jgi:hypothetical protein
VERKKLELETIAKLEALAGDLVSLDRTGEPDAPMRVWRGLSAEDRAELRELIERRIVGERDVLERIRKEPTPPAYGGGLAFSSKCGVYVSLPSERGGRAGRSTRCALRRWGRWRPGSSGGATCLTTARTSLRTRPWGASPRGAAPLQRPRAQQQQHQQHKRTRSSPRLHSAPRTSSCPPRPPAPARA